MSRNDPILVETSPGDLIDQITILEIKSERFSDPGKLGPVRARLASLVRSRDRHISPSPQLMALRGELKCVNEQVWQAEDEIRACERDQDFGERFVEVARSIYRHNDRRAALKRQIDELLGAPWGEEKGYVEYE